MATDAERAVGADVDAKRRGAARRRRVERRVRHKVVEVRLRADEELEVRRADGAVLVGVELRQLYTDGFASYLSSMWKYASHPLFPSLARRRL